MPPENNQPPQEPNQVPGQDNYAQPPQSPTPQQYPPQQQFQAPPQFQPVAPQQAYLTEPPSKKPFPKWLIIVGIVAGLFIAGIIALVTIIFVSVNAATKAAQEVSDTFVNDLQAGNSTAAYALTNDVFKNATSKDQLDQILKQVGPQLQGDESVTGKAVHKKSGSQEMAAIVYDLKSPKGTNYMKIVLQKSGDQWQVVNFRLSQQSYEATIE